MNSKKIFLVIDDDPDDCYFFTEAIHKIDASVKCLTAMDGEDALRKLRNGMERKPDLIFLDLNMPRMDGRVCLAELKKDKALKHIPVIILSTSSSENDIDETKKLGAVYFITKPTDISKLHQELAFAMQTYQDTKG
ncbi:MAG: response regulator [Chitinophagaceae bacterium]|nr:response regulator [Chitinophagaceae bacterium]